MGKYTFLNLQLLICKRASYLTDPNWVWWNEELLQLQKRLLLSSASFSFQQNLIPGAQATAFLSFMVWFALKLWHKPCNLPLTMLPNVTSLDYVIGSDNLKFNLNILVSKNKNTDFHVKYLK